MKKVAIFTGFFLWMFFITVIHLGIVRSGRTISRLQNDVEIKEARNQYLQLEIARLSGPETVIRFAQTELGLRQLKPHEIIALENSK